MFVTLIALAALMISAVALVRSVDTATIIAGNLAFKQSATSSGDLGIRRAMTALAAIPTANLINHNPTIGYYAAVTTPVLDLSPGSNVWRDNSSSQETPVPDAAGNQTRYVIQRMANATGACTPSICLYNATPAGGNTAGFGGGTGEPPPAGGTGNLVLYRITVQTTGARGAVAYLQVFAN